MNWKLIGLSLLLADFVALTAWVVADYGYIGTIEAFVSTKVGWLGAADLVIALGFALAWMIPDAKARGFNVWPYVVVTLVFGSAGPLAYAVRRELGTVRGDVAAAVPA